MNTQNDLDAAVREWICGHADGEKILAKDAFKAGANWQREQMLKNIVLETVVMKDDDGAYFSEKSVKQYLRHLIDEINKDYSFATTGKPFRYVRYDVAKTIDEFVGRLKGGNNA